MRQRTFKEISQNIKEFFLSDRFHFILMAVGILLRLKHYMENRSFWVDETYMALQIVNRSWSEIIHFIRFLPAQPIHPLFFTLIEKTFVSIGGNYEWVLRLFPFLCGISSIFLFYSLSKRYLDRGAVPMALGLFVLSGGLIYYSAELKTYSTDVLAVLFLFLFFEKRNKKPFRFWEAVLWGIVGGWIIWISYASLFVLGSIGIIFCISLYRRRKWGSLILFFVTCRLWLGSFMTLYQVALSPMAHAKHLYDMWDRQHAFMPYPALSLGSILWLKDALIRLFQNPVGISFPYFAMFVFVVGCVGMYKRNKQRFFLLLGPLFLILLAAILRKYPFHGRTLLFLVPSILLFIAQGCFILMKRIKKGAFLIGLLMVGLLFLQPAKMAVYYLFNSREAEENRLVMEYLKENYRQGDLICVNISGLYPYHYYSSRPDINKIFPLRLVDTTEGYLLQGPQTGVFYKDIMRYQGNTFVLFDYERFYYNQEGLFRRELRNKEFFRVREGSSLKFIHKKRVWLLFMHVVPETQRFILELFEKNGRRVGEVERKGSSIYLYELSG